MKYVKHKMRVMVDGGPNKTPTNSRSYDGEKMVELLDELSRMFDDWLEIRIILTKEGDENG